MQCYMEKMNEAELHGQHRLKRICTIRGMKTHTKKPLLYLGIHDLSYIQSIFIEFLPWADAVSGTGDIAENKAKCQLS